MITLEKSSRRRHIIIPARGKSRRSFRDVCGFQMPNRRRGFVSKSEKLRRVKMKHRPLVEFQILPPGQIQLDQHPRLVKLLSVRERPPAGGRLVKLPIRKSQHRPLRFADGPGNATAKNHHARQNNAKAIHHTASLPKFPNLPSPLSIRESASCPDVTQHLHLSGRFRPSIHSNLDRPSAPILQTIHHPRHLHPILQPVIQQNPQRFQQQLPAPPVSKPPSPIPNRHSTFGISCFLCHLDFCHLCFPISLRHSSSFPFPSRAAPVSSPPWKGQGRGPNRHRLCVLSLFGVWSPEVV